MSGKTSPVIKKITIYTNGHAFCSGRKIIINQQHVPTFESLLTTLTCKIGAPFGAVRKLYTVGGVRILGLDDLQHGGAYVATGYEKFKKLDYCGKPPRPQPQESKAEKIKPVEAVAVHKKRKIEFCTINVFANGEARVPAVQVKIPQYALRNMGTILTMVTEKMCLRPAVNRLYTLDGHPIEDPTKLKTNEHYVAVRWGKFRPLAYGQEVSPSCKTTSRNERKDTTPAVGTLRRAQNMRADAGCKEVTEVTSRDRINKAYSKPEGPQQQRKGSRIPVAPSAKGSLPARRCSVLATNTQKPQKEEIKPVVQGKAEVTGHRQRKPAFCTLNVFANGETRVPAVQVKIPQYALRNMGTILTLVTEKMCLRTAAKRLYTLDGHPVEDPTKLKTNEHYVAVRWGKFRPLAYGQEVSPSCKTTSRNERKDTTPAVGTKRRAQNMRADAGCEEVIEVTPGDRINNATSIQEGPQQQRKGSRIPVAPSAKGDGSPRNCSVPAKPKPQTEKCAGVDIAVEEDLNNAIVVLKKPKKKPTRLIRDPSGDVACRQDNKLLIQVLENCSIVYDFVSVSVSSLAKKADKEMMLQELVRFFIVNRSSLSKAIYLNVVSMYAANVFRTLPPASNTTDSYVHAEDNQPVFEPAWPHLQLVGNVFLAFLQSCKFEPKKSKKYIDQRFIIHLLEQFQSEDPRQRELLKIILFSIYTKIVELREFIIQEISHTFCRFIYENEQPNGISELLEILGSIISELAPPLTEDIKTILVKVLMPLHKMRSLPAYYEQLVYCVVGLLSKDSTLLEQVVRSLLRYWPKTNVRKEMMFIVELQDIFGEVDPSEFVKVQEPLFRQLAKCVSSLSSEVAEKALILWNFEPVTDLIRENAATLIHIMFPVLYESSKTQQESLRELIYRAVKPFVEMDPNLFEECAQKLREEPNKQQERSNERREAWIKIENLAKSNAKKTT